MALDVHVRTVAPQPILSATKHTKVERLEQVILETLDNLLLLVEEQGGTVSGAPFGMYHGQINEEDDGPIEICIPVKQMLASRDGAVARELEGGQVASVMVEGNQCEFPAILKAYDAAYDWIRHNGYEIQDSPREVWLSKRGEYPRMEIAWPFREKAR